MNVNLHIPRGGDRVSAAYMARILAEIRANRILPSPGTRVSRGPHGTHISVDIPKRASASAADKGCWRIVAEKIEVETGGETATATIHYIDRQYYQVGGLLQEGHDKTTLESFVIDRKPFIAAVIVYTSEGNNKRYSCSIQGFASFFEMQALSFEPGCSIIPLYELKLPEGQSVNEQRPPITIKIDFRTIPVVQAFEMPAVSDNEEAE